MMETERPILWTLIMALSLSGGLWSAHGHAVEVEGNIRRPPGNLLSNPNFSAVLPKDWTRDAWIFSDNLFLFRQPGRTVGLVGISIPEEAPNDVRWIQTVNIEPYRDYRLSGWIRTRNVGHTSESIDAGANLSALNWGSGQGIIDIVTEPLFGTNEWTYREVQFNAGPHAQVTVALRVGFFSGTTTGTAWFRNVRLQRIR